MLLLSLIARRGAFLGSLLLFCAIGSSRVAAQNDQVIYDDNLENGWEDWGWANAYSYANTSPVYSGSDSVSVTCVAWQALYIAHNAFDSSAYTNLVFWVNGGSTGGQKLSVCAHVSGNPTPWFALPPLTANTWTKIVLPLSAIGAADVPGLDGVWFGDDTGQGLATFYLDDISLQAGSEAASQPTNLIGIDVAVARHPISPMIYGTAFATSNQLADLHFTMNRSGGNEESTYNWKINAHGKGADWYFESYPDASSVPGQSADSVVAASKAAGAQPLITIPMLDWGPKLGPNRSILPSYSVAKYGPQTGDDPYRTDAGSGFVKSNGAAITWNDPNDANVPVDANFQQGYVGHLTNNWGVSSSGGVRYYIMDNEHSLWQSTHQDIHPVGATMQEILGKMIAYASMVKDVDSNALVLGPEEWGWPGYLYSGYDQQWSGARGDYNANDYPDRKTNGGWDYMPWLLAQLHRHDTNTGRRLLDYFTLHCYPQEGSVSSSASDTATELLRNQSTRQFWDTNYVDPSWINNIIMLIPRMKNWVATNYPGTKIGVTEYNWGAEPYINGATAQADLLGIFGREGLDLATRWTTPDPSTPTYKAMKLYRNYDGQDSAFGDTSVLAAGPNPDDVAVFAAQRGADAALTVMAVNKYLTGALPLSISWTNFSVGGPVQVWQLNASNIIARLPDLVVAGNALQLTVPGPSITLFVIPADHSLTFTSGPARSDSQVEFWLTGQLGESYTLQSSPDLKSWSAISTGVFTNAPEHFLLPASGTALFYRAVTPQ